MTLIDAVSAIGTGKTDGEIRDELSVDVDLPYNTERWSAAGVAARFGAVVAEGIGAAMVAAGMNTLHMTYATFGLDLSLDETQGHLAAIAAGALALETPNQPLADACNALKAIGRPTAKRYTQYGLDALPSESDVAAAKVQLDKQQRWAHFANEVAGPMVSDPSKVWADIQAAITGA